MNDQNKNTGQNTDFTAGDDNFFDKVETPFVKTKDEVWESLAAQLNEKTESHPVRRLFPVQLRLGLAAAVLLLAGIFSILRFYTTTLRNPSGKHFTASLPDGSVVELNALSTLSYHPLWWWYSREVDFEGEAFFEVQKGSAFKVNSAMGKTIVLGTSFNVFTRDAQYKVTCITGKVKVVSVTKQEVVLSPGYHAEVEQGGSIRVFKNYPAKQAISWRDGMFTFTSTPLAGVVREIERQYAVSITLNTQTTFYYTGFFSREMPVEEVLGLLCKTFNLTFDKVTDKHYRISEN